MPRRNTVRYADSEDLPSLILLSVNINQKKTSSARVFFCFIRQPFISKDSLTLRDRFNLISRKFLWMVLTSEELPLLCNENQMPTNSSYTSLLLISLTNNNTFFIRKIFIIKLASKTQKPLENVEKTSSLKCLSCNFQKH